MTIVEDAERVRRDVTSFWQSARWRTEYFVRMGFAGTEFAGTLFGEELLEELAGDLYAVSSDVGEKIREMSLTLPDVPLRREMMLARAGFVYFDGAREWRLDRDVTSPVVALSWDHVDLDEHTNPNKTVRSLHVGVGPSTGIGYSVYTRVRSGWTHVPVPAVLGSIPFNHTFEDCYRDRLKVGVNQDSEELLQFVHRFFITFQLFCKQRISRIERAVAGRSDRAARRFWSAKGWPEREVTVVKLRAYEGRAAGGSRDVLWKHSWDVRGHWRTRLGKPEYVHAYEKLRDSGLPKLERKVVSEVSR